MRYHMESERLLRSCAREARNLGHSYVGSVHLLLVMCREPEGMGLVLRQLGVDPELTEAMARLLYGAGTPDLPLPQGLTPEVRELLRTAAREAKQRSERCIQPHHFLLAMARQEKLTVPFLYGLGLLPIIGWVSGTLFGALAGSILPQSIRMALGVMLYGMFIAIVIPPAKKERPVAVTALLALVLSSLFAWVPALSKAPTGTPIVICTVAAAAVCAWLFPIKEEAE